MHILINIVREPRRNANIFGNNGPDGLFGSSSTWYNLDEAGDDSVSDIDIIIFSLPTQHEITGREIRYAMEIFALN